MKTIAKYILAIGLLALAVSCENLLIPKGYDDAEMVEVTMSFAFPEPVAISTKAQMSEGPTADEFNIYLCVYGPGEGYVQNWIQPLETTMHSDENGFVDRGTFKALLPITEDNRTIHILVNPPASVVPTASDYIDNVMEQMVTTDGECAYWQQIELDKIDAGNEMSTTTGYPKASATVEAAFTDVHLVRNFAKLIVTSDLITNGSYFEVKRWTLINVPDKAYIAPYMSSGSYRFPNGYLNIANYLSDGSLYSQLTTTDNYPGVMPTDATINTDFPSDLSKYAVRGGAQYMYERPVPTTAGEQTAILVEIQFDQNHNPGSRTDRTYWYKVEVIDNNGEYIPMFRDIAYTLKIEGIQEEGAATAQAAYNGPYFGNISASLETASLNDLSDGTSQIHVDVMDFTFMGADGGSTFTLMKSPTEAAQYWFKPTSSDTPKTQSVTDVCDIKVELLPVAGSQPAVADGSLVTPGDGSIKITLNAASATAIKKSIIRVSGRIGNNVATNTHKYLYREINITLMEKQNLAVTVTAPDGKTDAGKPVNFALELPEGLSASVFPIQLRIEAKNNSLCAYSPDLPASTGLSEFDGQRDLNTYYFIYTINFSDYRTLDPVTKKYVYHYDHAFTMYTSKRGDNSTPIKIRDLAGKFNETDVTL